MKPSSSIRRSLIKISGFFSSVNQLAFSAVPIMITWAMEALETIGSYFFIPTWILDGINYSFKSAALLWAPNKNIQKVSSLFLNWISFGVSGLLMFGSMHLGMMGAFAIMVTMLAVTPASFLIKSCWYLASALRSNNLTMRANHFKEARNALFTSIVALMISAAFGCLIFIPGLPQVAAITLTVLLSAILIPMAVAGIVTSLVDFGKWAARKINKLMRSPEEIAAKYDAHPQLQPRPVLVELPIPMLDQALTKNAVNLHGELHNNIDSHIETIHQQINNQDGLFQSSKRQNKLEALIMLQSILQQWDALVSNSIHDLEEKTYEIHLGQNDIVNIANLHNDPNAARNIEKIIKRIKQHVAEVYPDAFQSFFKKQGHVEMLFEEAFDYMKTMKIEDEVQLEDASALSISLSL